ncbi:MAG: hypothetical protein ACREX3_07410 [Gammaproteobacteria bacterium]
MANEGLDHGDLPWPPVPRGIENVIVHSKPAEDLSRERRRDQRFRNLEDFARRNPAVDFALGANPTRIGVIDDANNDKFKDKIRLEYFNRDKNATIEVTLDGDKVRRLKIIPANEYQPEITDEEATEAITLARDYLANRGFLRVLGLKGFGILAYKPQGKGFYDGRVIYVSFHEHDDAPPEFAAWVDLTKQKILKTRREHQ